MQGKESQIFDLEHIYQEFKDPLNDIDEFEVESQELATQEISCLCANLDQKVAWNTRLGALKHVRELIKGGIHYYECGNFRSVVPIISNILVELRAVMVKQAALVITAMAGALQDDFAAQAASLFPVLVKQLTNGNAQIANFCHLTLLEIVRFCQNKRIGTLFLSLYNSKIPAERQIAVEAAHIITQTWQPVNFEALSENVANVIETLMNDAYVEISHIAKVAADVRKLTKKAKKIPESTLPITRIVSSKNQRSPVKTQAKPVASVEPNDDLCSVMPPKDESEAHLFKTLLDENEMPISDKLVQSIERCVSWISGQMNWETTIRKITHGANMKQFSLKLLEIFNFEPWIMTIIHDEFPLQQIAESLPSGTITQSKASIQFLISVAQMDPPPITVTEKVRSISEMFIKRYEKANKLQEVMVIKQFLDSSKQPTESTAVTNLALQWIRRGMEKFPIADFSTITGFSPDFSDSLAAIIEEGTDEQKLRVIEFITKAAAKMKSTSFAPALEKMTQMLTDSESPYHQSVVVCFSKALWDVKVMAIVIKLLEEKSDAQVLEALRLYITDTAPQRLVPIEKIVVRKLSPLLTEKDRTVRKTVVAILAEFKRKIPKEFSKHLKKLAPTQQRLVELKAAQSAI